MRGKIKCIPKAMMIPPVMYLTHIDVKKCPKDEDTKSPKVINTKQNPAMKNKEV
uniref:Uncharacterized protein n=1 Tax=uncultured Helicobacter sp. TaxID=175537 RepID=A0A650ELP2_9HELI|nr:hypothetical protein Helico5904_0240 [uncultured Helicobacter sp.]